MPAIPDPSRAHQLTVKVGLALASAALCLMGAEAVFRVWAWQEDRSLLSETSLGDALPPEGSTVPLRDLIRLSADSRMIYELKPDLQGVIFEGRRVSTNQRGFITPESQIPKPEGTIRVVGLGDSVMFGWKMPEGKGYLAVLERQLEQQQPHREWEFVNMAVPGYNTVMEVAALEEKALDLKPDLVIVGLTRNDLGLPNFIRERRAYLAWNRSFLVDFVRERYEQRPRRDGLQPAPLADDAANFLGDPARVPAEYRAMVGLDGFESALTELNELARSYDFGVIFVTLFGTAETNPLLELARDHGFEAVAAIPDIWDYRNRHGGKSLLELGLFVDAADDHPSARAHEMIARALLTVLEDPGALDRLRAQVRPVGQG